MNLKTTLSTIKWANWISVVIQLIGIITGAFPAQPWTPALLAAQAILQGFMTSIGGFAHKASFGENQTPGDRTAGEVMKAANEATATLVAAAPAGEAVTVPSVTLATSTGTK